MKDLIAVKVECYSGYKPDEYPLRFYWDTIKFEIVEVLDRWYQGSQSVEFPAADYFKVRTSDQKVFILKHETAKDKWFLWIQGESLNL